MERVGHCHHSTPDLAGRHFSVFSTISFLLSCSNFMISFHKMWIFQLSKSRLLNLSKQKKSIINVSFETLQAGLQSQPSSRAPRKGTEHFTLTAGD